jgi:ribosomal protein S17
MATANEQLEALLNSMVDPLAEDSQNMTGIIYGDNGGGKTICAIKLAKGILEANRRSPDDYILFIDAVNAWRSLKNHPDLQGDVKRVRYEGKSQLDLLNTVLEAVEAGANLPKIAAIRVIILDEMSSMTDHDGDIVLAAGAKADPNKDPDVLTQPDMGKTNQRMRRTITTLLKRDVSVIMVCHQRQDEDKAVGYKVTRPRFMPMFNNTVREGLDFVAHMTAEPLKTGDTVTYSRRLQLNPTKTVNAKTRIGGLGLYADPDTFIRTAVEWMKGKGKSNDSLEFIDDTPVDTTEITDASDYAGIEIQ